MEGQSIEPLFFFFSFFPSYGKYILFLVNSMLANHGHYVVAAILRCGFGDMRFVIQFPFDWQVSGIGIYSRRAVSNCCGKKFRQECNRNFPFYSLLLFLL